MTVEPPGAERTLRIDVLHGPNLDLLGERDPDLYGKLTLAEIDERLQARAGELGVELSTFQSNHEGELIERVHRQRKADGWVVNAAAYTHTSVALRDALQATGRPFVEVHLSNIHARERFRRRSLLADVAVGVVAGFREQSYLLALEGLVAHLRASR